MLRKFASIAHPETYGYAFDSDAWTSHAPVYTNFRMYQTFGHENYQHSGDWAITTEFFADYLMSLAKYMLTDPELTQRLQYTMTPRPSKEAIEFCSTVVFKPIDEAHPWEKKTRYFSIEEKKISTTESKQYDKRYQRVEKQHTGSPAEIYNMLIPEYASGLERILYATSIREWYLAAPGRGGWMDLPARFLKWTEDHQQARDMMHALEATQYVCEAYRLRCAAESNIESAQREAERRKEAAAESKKEEIA